MEASFVFKKFDVEVVSSIFKKYPLTKGIFSTVIDKDDELVEYLGSNLRNFVFLDETVYGEIAFGCRAGIHSFGRNGYGNSHPGWSSKWYSVRDGWVYRNASAKIS